MKFCFLGQCDEVPAELFVIYADAGILGGLEQKQIHNHAFKQLLLKRIVRGQRRALLLQGTHGSGNAFVKFVTGNHFIVHHGDDLSYGFNLLLRFGGISIGRKYEQQQNKKYISGALHD